MRVCLFEDKDVANLEPLSWSRPAFELLCGQTSLAAKQCRFFAPCEIGVLIRPCLIDLFRSNHPSIPVNDLAWLRSDSTILVNSRWLPPAGHVADSSAPRVVMLGEEVAYAVLLPEQLTYCSPNTLEDCLATWKNTLPHVPAGGRLVRYLWELVDANAAQLIADFEESRAGQRSDSLHRGLALVGPADKVFIDPTARVEALSLADTTRGPVVIDREAVVTAFSRLEGPCYIGPRTHILGAKIRSGTTAGPDCRLGGEIEASIIQGHTNKYHDGFLGHSYVGEWVNLGAGTSNSDLRNDYGDVQVTVNGQVVNTGLTKVGCFLGDHAKTGLGALINTGTSAGVFCNLLPTGRFLPKVVPSFCTVWHGELQENSDLASLFRTADKVMARRGAAFCSAHAALFRHVFQATARARGQVLPPARVSPLRRSA